MYGDGSEHLSAICMELLSERVVEQWRRTVSCQRVSRELMARGECNFPLMVFVVWAINDAVSRVRQVQFAFDDTIKWGKL